MEPSAGRPFGVTSHFRGKFQHPHLPWKQFFEQADILLPQSYWRTSKGRVKEGDPAANFREGILSWVATGGSLELICPMAGELASAQEAELSAYAAQAAQSGVASGHFYTYDEKVADGVWAAIAPL